MKQPQVLPIGSDRAGFDSDLLTQKELRFGRFPSLYRIMTVFSHPRG